ncbi:MAG: rod shape-determining protein MreD [Bacteroidales bacterium]
MFRWKLFLLFVALVLLQVLILNNVYLGGYINPQVYVLFILVLPFNIRGWHLLLLAFLQGLVIDVFEDSLAIHAASTVMVAFARPFVLKLLTGKQPDDVGDAPSFRTLGTMTLFVYSLILIFLHHLVLFVMETFYFRDFTETMVRVVFSTALSLLFVLIGFGLFNSSSAKR